MTQPCRQSLKVTCQISSLIWGKAERCPAFLKLFYRTAKQQRFTLSPGFISGTVNPFDLSKSHIRLSSDQIRSLPKLALKDPIAKGPGSLDATCYIPLWDASGETLVCWGSWFSHNQYPVGDPGSLLSWIRLQAGPRKSKKENMPILGKLN